MSTTEKPLTEPEIKEFQSGTFAMNMENGCEHKFEWIDDNDIRRKKFNCSIECWRCHLTFSPAMINQYVELVKKHASTKDFRR